MINEDNNIHHQNAINIIKGLDLKHNFICKHLALSRWVLKQKLNIKYKDKIFTKEEYQKLLVLLYDILGECTPEEVEKMKEHAIRAILDIKTKSHIEIKQIVNTLTTASLGMKL